MIWRLEIRNPVGVLKGYKGMADPISELDGFSVAGDGDCLEAQLIALASRLEVEGRDIVVLQTSSDSGASWNNWHAGVTTKPGARRSSNNSRFKVVGLRKRVDETPTGGDIFSGKHDVATIVRSLAQAHLPPEVIYDASLIPNVGFSFTDAKANYDNLGVLLSKLAKTCPGFVVAPGASFTYDGRTYQEGEYVPAVTWGVRADRRLFFGRIRNTLELTEGVDGVGMTPKEADHETLVTAVTIIYGVGEDGVVGYYYEAPEAVAQGVSNKNLPLNLVLLAQAQASTTTADEQSDDGGATWVAFDGSVSYLADGDNQTILRVYNEDDGGLSLPVLRFAAVEVAFDTPVYVGSVDLKAEAFGPGPLNLELRVDGERQTAVSLGSSVDGPVSVGKTASSIQVGVLVGSPGADYHVQVHRMLALVTDTEQLKRIARSEIRLPATEVAEVTVPGRLVEPRTHVELTLADGEVITEGAETFVYTITKKRGIETIIKLGQKDDADLTAVSDLIQHKADQAALGSISYTNLQRK